MRSCRSAICRQRSSRGSSTSSSSQLELQLADRNVHIDLDEEAREWLTNRGYDKLYGARPMGRLVQEKIKQPLAEELLFGKLVNGGEVKVRIKDNAPSFEIVPAPPKAARTKPKQDRQGRRLAAKRPRQNSFQNFPQAAGTKNPCCFHVVQD